MAQATKRWTETRIKRELRRLISSDQVHIEIRRLASTDCSAEAYWYKRDGDVFLTVDQDQEGRVRAVVHELLHFILEGELRSRFAPTVEEPMINGLETYFYRWIQKNSRRFNWWRRAVSLKLDEADGE